VAFFRWLSEKWGQTRFFFNFLCERCEKKTAKKTAQLRFSAVFTRHGKQQTGLTPIVFAAASIT
jgi:hypothetical protein